MELIFRMAGKPTLMRLPSKSTLSVGRSHNADYQIEGVRVSAYHVQITAGPDPATITITDISQNGTGLVAAAPRRQQPPCSTKHRRQWEWAQVSCCPWSSRVASGRGRWKTSSGLRLTNNLIKGPVIHPGLQPCHSKTQSRHRLRGQTSG